MSTLTNKPGRLNDKPDKTRYSTRCYGSNHQLCKNTNKKCGCPCHGMRDK